MNKKIVARPVDLVGAAPPSLQALGLDPTSLGARFRQQGTLSMEEVSFLLEQVRFVPFPTVISCARPSSSLRLRRWHGGAPPPIPARVRDAVAGIQPCLSAPVSRLCRVRAHEHSRARGQTQGGSGKRRPHPRPRLCPTGPLDRASPSWPVLARGTAVRSGAPGSGLIGHEVYIHIHRYHELPIHVPTEVPFHACVSPGAMLCEGERMNGNMLGTEGIGLEQPPPPDYTFGA